MGHLNGARGSSEEAHSQGGRAVLGDPAASHGGSAGPSFPWASPKGPGLPHSMGTVSKGREWKLPVLLKVRPSTGAYQARPRFRGWRQESPFLHGRDDKI